MGDLTFILELQIKQKKNDIIICQSKYIRDLLKKYNMDQCKSANTPTPMSATIRLDQDLNGKSVNLRYDCLLLYLTASRPNIIH